MDMNSLTPEQIQAILGAGEDDPAYAQADSKQKIADMMRKASMGGATGGRMVGNMYIAPGLGETLANAAGGMMNQQSADTLRGEAHGRTVGARQSYGQAMIEAMRKRQAVPGGVPAGPAQTPPTSMVDPYQNDDNYSGTY